MLSSNNYDPNDPEKRKVYKDAMWVGMPLLAQNATLAVKFAQSQALTQDTAIRNLLCTRASSLLFI
jgi:hypothetical protein